MTGRKRYALIRDYLLIFLGTGLLALAYQCIFDPTGLVTGGFTGLAIILKNVTRIWLPQGIPLWLTNLVLNIPVFWFAWRKMGAKFIGRTFFGTMMLSVWLYCLPVTNLVEKDYLLAALFGGVLSGAGIGLVLRAGATTGGTDMVAALVHRKVRHHTVAQILQMIDGAVVLLGLYVFGVRPTLYAIVAIYTATQVSDALLEGFKRSRAAFIITPEYKQVAQALMELDRGVTGLRAQGMYTNEEKCVLYCVFSPKQIAEVKERIAEIDPNAFVIVSDVSEVLGEGFQSIVKNY